MPKKQKKGLTPEQRHEKTRRQAEFIPGEHSQTPNRRAGALQTSHLRRRRLFRSPSIYREIQRNIRHPRHFPLPSAHTGGHLLIRHGGREIRAERRTAKAAPRTLAFSPVSARRSSTAGSRRRTRGGRGGGRLAVETAGVPPGQVVLKLEPDVPARLALSFPRRGWS